MGGGDGASEVVGVDLMKAGSWPRKKISKEEPQLRENLNIFSAIQRDWT